MFAFLHGGDALWLVLFLSLAFVVGAAGLGIWLGSVTGKSGETKSSSNKKIGDGE
jgi:hypothetical protein